MAQQGKSDDLVTFQALAVSNAYEIAAIVAVLEQKGIVTQCGALYANMDETLPPSEFRVEGGEEMSDERTA